MLDNDNLTYKKNVIGKAAAKQAERTLITLERSQKLDLLIHLLANLRQALIVCGPKGIGKTTLLQTLQDRRKDQWQICLLQGSSALSFESVINNLSQFLNLNSSNFGFDLSSLRAYCEKQKVVLIVDDAGELVPGLIGELVDFADSLSGLRLVFSMTYDEFHIKNASDKAVDDCHFIELPPLSLKQCAEYLQNLSAQPGAMLAFNAVTDTLVEDLYRETHGIPGKILAEIPKLNEYQSRKKGRLGLWVSITVIVLAAGWTVTALLPTTPPSETKIEVRSETPEPVPSQPPVVDIETIAPNLTVPAPSILQEQYPAPTVQTEPASPGLLETPVSKPASPESSNTQPAKAPDTIVATPKPAAPEANATSPTVQTPQPPVAPAAKTEESTPVTQATEVKPPEAPIAPATAIPEPKPAEPMSDLDWIKAQPAKNYTVQIMVLSNKDSVNRYLKKHAQYRDNLKYYTIKRGDLEKYVLIYGSFQSSADARQQKATMPDEFRNGLEKQFKSIQPQIRR